jgi:hypothetical protein
MAKENRELISAAWELSIGLHGWKENVCGMAVRKPNCGVGWLSNFNHDIDVISGTNIKKFSRSRIWGD